MAKTKKTPKLNRILGNFSAVSISIGGIIGSGIFFILGIAAGVAGPGIILSLILAGIVAFLTALSFASLSSQIPKEGGEYQFVYHAFGRRIGFLTGIAWLLITGIGGVTASLALSSYSSVLVPLFPIHIMAALIIITFVLIDVLGVHLSSKINNIFVLVKVSTILVFILLTLPVIKPSNFDNLFEKGNSGILAGAFLIFFAYAGFGKITAAAEEVKQSRKTIPKALLIAIIISTILYIILGVSAVGSVGTKALSSPGHSLAPLSYVMQDLGYSWGFLLISIGAIIATANVLLIQILGLSRNIYAMARNKQLPEFLSELHPQFKTPYKAEIILGVLMALTALFMKIRFVIAITSIGILSYYSLVNLAALVINRKHKFNMVYVTSILGFVSCIALILYYLIVFGL